MIANKIAGMHSLRTNDDVMYCMEEVTIQCLKNATTKLNMTDKPAMSSTALVFVAVANLCTISYEHHLIKT